MISTRDQFQTLFPDFAFKASGILRFAELREDPVETSRLTSQPGAAVLPFYRGQPLKRMDSSLCWLPPDDRIFSDNPTLVFVGKTKEETLPRFAAAISDNDPSRNDPVTTDGVFDPAPRYHPLVPDNTEFADLRSFMAALPATEAEFAVMGKALLNWHASFPYCPRCGCRMGVVAAGWRLECHNCECVQFCRIDPVVIMLVTHQDQLLLGRSPGWPEGMHSLPAGFVEAGETIEAAVCRETLEETGIRVDDVKYVFSQPWPFPASLMIGCAGRARNTAIRIDHDELETAFWISRQQMAQVFDGQDRVIRPPRRGSIAHDMIRMWLQGRIN
ncbi:MAG: NAD(+) diphosphatase [Rhodobacteraceae bacterium]|nr:NAD(+) diphosphatase [Paracoccaceae bacterium]